MTPAAKRLRRMIEVTNELRFLTLRLHAVEQEARQLLRDARDEVLREESQPHEAVTVN